MNSEYHSLLRRQIKRYFEGVPPPAFSKFLEAVDSAYREFDQDRNMLERSLEFSSQEIFQANSDIRASENRLKIIYDASPLGIVFSNEWGGWVYMNATMEKICGRTPEEMAGAGWRQAVHPEDRAHVIAEWEKSVSSGSEYESEHRYCLKDGRVVWVSVRASAIRSALAVKGHVISVENITERKKLTSQLLQAQKMDTIGTLAGGIAHDLNNQLTPLRGYIDLLLAQSDPSAPDHEYLKEINDASIRCVEIVQQLVNFSRPSTEVKSSVDLRSLLSELKNVFMKFVPSTIRVQIEHQPDLWSVTGNQTELHSVFMNFAANARDAMPAGGDFWIRADNAVMPEGPGGSKKRAVLISVRDSGCGMTAEVVHRIFEPFYTTKRSSGGTGLGMTMAFQIVRNHGGVITVSSEPGKGTCFQIYLPASSGESETAAPPVPGGQAGGNETLLFADDEETIRHLGKRMLEGLGYKVILAKNGVEAIEAYRKHGSSIDAAILDMTMPLMSGRETFQSILRIDPKAKIILASGYTAEGSIQQLLSEGAAVFIQKPYTISQLALSLRRVLDGLTS